MRWLLLALVCLSATACAEEHTALLLHLDEGAGEACADTSGQEIGVSLEAAPRRPTWAEGWQGQCLRFDGDNADADGDGKGEADGVLISGEQKLAQSGPVSVEMWIRPERVEGRQTLIALNSMNGRYTFFLDGGTPEIWMAFADAEGERVYRHVKGFPVIEVDVWQHVAFTFDGTAMRALVNGVEVGQEPVTLQRYATDILAVTTLGRDGDVRPVPGGIRGYKGLIDEVRISRIARDEFDVPAKLTARTEGMLTKQEADARFAHRYPDSEPKPTVERDVTVTGIVTLNGEAAANAQVSDGETIVTTDAAGRYTLRFHVDEARYVCATRPNGMRPTSPWAVLIDAAEAQTQYEIDFAFAPDPGSLRSSFNFLQTSDSQFTSPEQMTLIRDDYAQITAMTGEPAFLVCPGDLTMSGTHYELDMYSEVCTAARIDLYNVFGGHDGNYGAPDYSTANYKQKIGPTHFAWNYGGVHFMAWITEMHYPSAQAAQRQTKWIEADLAAQPEGTPILAITHIPHNRHEIARWLDEGYNIIGWLFGHWHAVTQNAHLGIPLLNCSPIRGGDWGALTRAFRINTIENGKLTHSEVRPTGQYQRLEIVHPRSALSAPLASIRALAFDSASRVERVSATVTRAGAPESVIAEIPLEQIGQWTWGADLPEALTEPGAYEIAASVTDDRGRTWQSQQTLEITDGARPEIALGDDWPSLLGRAAGHRTAGDELKPPLAVAWVANTGGNNQLAGSPVIADGRVYVGIQTHDIGWRGAGLACYDAATGEKLWFTATDSSIRFAPAVFDDAVVAVSHQGTVYGVTPDTGTIIWRYDLYPDPPSNIYRSLNKPVVACDGAALIARDSASAVLLDPLTGELIAEYGGESGIYYAFPTGYGDRVFSGARNKCQAYDRESREQAWEAPAQTGKATSAPVLHQDRLYLNAAQLHCYEPRSGELLWSAAMSIGSNAVSAPVFWGELVIANGSVMRAFDRLTGELAWEFRYPDTSNEHNKRQRLGGMSTPVVAGDVLYAGSENGHLYALDAATGEVIWDYDLGLPIKSWPAASGNALYLCDYDGNLWAFVSSGE